MARLRYAFLLGTVALSGNYLNGQTPTQMVEPGAGSWRTWIISSGRDLQVTPPDRAGMAGELTWLREFMRSANDQALAQMDYWDIGAPSSRWMDLISDRVRREQISRTDTPRVYALVTAAMYDATIAAWYSKYIYNRPRPSEVDTTLAPRVAVPKSPSYPSEYAATAAAAASVLAYFYPQEAMSLSWLAEEAARSRLTAGVEFPSDMIRGLELGRAVAAKVIEYAQNDGTQTPFAGTIPTGPGFWTGTNPVWANAQSWRPFTLSRPDEFRPSAPPAYDSAQTRAELAEIKNFPRDFNSNSKAFFWQTLEGNFTWFFDEISRKQYEYRLNTNPPRAVRAYALMGITQFDLFLASHDAKMTYFRARPNQLDPSIVTLFANPNHPSYPANHGITSGRTGLLAYLLPRHADYYLQLGDEIAWSRMWAGIHYRSDIEAGVALAKKVLERVVERAENDGSRMK
jgi:membrane-associated phospholipid phosphatase